MKKSTFLCAAIAALVAGFAVPTGIRALTEHQQSVAGKSFAAWRYPAVNLQQMVQEADVIAVVTATASHPGRVATSHQGESSHEFELVDFTVREVLKGSVGATLTVERDADVQNGRRVTSHDGGPFARETDHLIFLKKQPGTPYFILMNDQGRYAVGRGGRLESVRQGPVSAELRARQLPEAVGLVRRLARTP